MVAEFFKSGLGATEMTASGRLLPYTELRRTARTEIFGEKRRIYWINDLLMCSPNRTSRLEDDGCLQRLNEYSSKHQEAKIGNRFSPSQRCTGKKGRLR